MARKAQYQIVGRYMNGKEVVAYHLQDLEKMTDGRYTREQVCYLVGKNQVSNCTGQLYKDKVILRGVGMSLENLPVHQESTGEVSRTDNIGKVRKGSTAQDVMTQFMIVGAITQGKNTIGYVISNAAGETRDVPREQVLELASAGRIGNARVQNYQGKVLLRGVNCNLSQLPTTVLE